MGRRPLYVRTEPRSNTSDQEELSPGALSENISGRTDVGSYCEEDSDGEHENYGAEKEEQQQRSGEQEAAAEEAPQTI